jgi:magnesium-protoporphyrin O-methyltransferase
LACRCCAFAEAVEQQFTREKVAEELRRYRRTGIGPTTRLLRDGLAEAGLTSGALLDVGAGLGTLALELLDHGMTRAVIVEASTAYLAAASEEAARRHRSGLIRFVAGDFVTLASALSSVDVVTLDRVVCCYPLYEPLLEQAARHAERAIALSYPRDRWYVRIGMWLENAIRRWRANPFRTFVHDPPQMLALLERAGFELASRSNTFTWSADVFAKRRRSGPIGSS